MDTQQKRSQVGENKREQAVSEILPQKTWQAPLLKKLDTTKTQHGGSGGYHPDAGNYS